jgi:hypothetical protein
MRLSAVDLKHLPLPVFQKLPMKYSFLAIFGNLLRQADISHG